ncbi:GGDEF domain-containing protein [Allorhizocola rhizosphaerae]|uniref:GGDEF domain-containing protein n=1 Tax=Allorhizocola rhizosphaerae TaxID=1872709 RepID=UPI000E3C299A|nr:GGDEF domain-containing protein [Allorhizocola rhizosphaerae]
MASVASSTVAARPLGRAAPAYALASAALIAVYPLLPSLLRNVEYLLVTLITLVPVTAGLRRAATGDRRPWWLLLSALAASSVATVFFRWPAGAIPGPAQAFDTVSNLLFLIGVLTIVARRGRNDTGGLIDATIFSLAAGGLLWAMLLAPKLVGADAGRRAWVFATVFILSGVLGALVRLVLSAGSRVPALRLLLAAVALALAAKVTMVAFPGETGRVVASMMFLAAYGSVGLFGLDPSSAQLANPARVPADTLSCARLVFLGASLASVPLVIGIRSLLGLSFDGLFLVAGGVTIVPLVMLRIGRLAAERTRAELALRHEATHDPLTGLVNRREFTARLAEELGRPGTCAVLFCDLDGFKGVNDRLGHTGGDRLLVDVSRRMLACVPDGNLVGRFGGDEFLILSRQACPDEVSHLAALLRDELARPFSLGDDTVVIGATIGIAFGLGPDLDPDAAATLIDRADEAMYQAKAQRPEAAATHRL